MKMDTFLIVMTLFGVLLLMVACSSDIEEEGFVGEYEVVEHTSGPIFKNINWSFKCENDGEHYFVEGIDGRWRLEQRDEGTVLVSDYMEMEDVEHRIWFGTGIWIKDIGSIDFKLETIIYETKFEKDEETGQEISWHAQYKDSTKFSWKVIKI
jgi:hypothetical protein